MMAYRVSKARKRTDFRSADGQWERFALPTIYAKTVATLQMSCPAKAADPVFQRRQ